MKGEVLGVDASPFRLHTSYFVPFPHVRIRPMNMPPHPKLRLVQSQWIDRGDGQPALLLQDRLGLSGHAVVVPEALAPMLALCDGTRNPAGIRTALELRTGLQLDLPTVEAALAQLDNALLLDNERYTSAYRAVLEGYRTAPARSAALAGGSYPEDPAELSALLDGFLAGIAGTDGHETGTKRLRGIVCPHIDYDRGGPTYARLWDRVRGDLADADLFIIVGTDHSGGPAEVTLTRQSFQTPLGILRTDVDAVDAVATAVGEAAYASELNHLAEHSIELAAVWLHHLIGAREARILPVLCGSFHPFTQRNGRPDDVRSWTAAASALREIAQRERTLVIAAADLSHVGPAFGDPEPMDPRKKAVLSTFDMEMLETVSRGDREAFLDLLVRESDRYNVCGLPPIYLTLTMLGEVRGEVVDYAQCPAPNRSVVSIAGMLLREV